MTRKNTRRTLAAAFAIAALFAVSACSGGDSDTGSEGGSAVLLTNSDVSSWDPAKCGADQPGFGSCDAVYGALMRWDMDAQEAVPEMAESLTTDDGKTWTLTLREGLTFSDGTAFDADAVDYNWKRIADPATATRAINALRDVKWKVEDELNVSITLPKVNYQFPIELTTNLAFVGSPTAMDELGDDFFTKPVGAGAFLLTDWVQGTSTELKRNDDYWDAPRPYLDSVTVRIVPEDEVRADSLRSGEADINLHFLDDLNAELADEGFDSHTVSSLSGSVFAANAGMEGTDDPDVRLALAKATGAQAIVENLYPGADVPKTLIDETFDLDVKATLPEENLEEAQELLDGYLKRSGKSELKIVYSVGTWSPLLKQLSEFVQANLNRLEGLNVELDSLDMAAMTARTTAKEMQFGHHSVSGLALDSLYEFYHSSGSQNIVKYSDPKVDAALERARSTPDTAEAKAAYEEAVEIATASNVFNPYRRLVSYFQHNDKVTNLVQGGTFMALELDQLRSAG